MREVAFESPVAHPPTITDDALTTLMGVRKGVPLTSKAMARSLTVTFFPYGQMTPRLERFVSRLKESLAAAGVTVIPYDQALQDGRREKVREGIVIIAPGVLENGRLPVDHVSNLRTTTIVGILDAPCPADGVGELQGKLNRVVHELTWSIVQVVIFVTDERWTIATMNGAIIPCGLDKTFSTEVAGTLVPKLAAPVVPPHATDFEFFNGALDLKHPALADYVTDFVEAGPLWGSTGLMLFHTSMEELAFRTPFYKRIAAAYLDRRSGMSYGFLAHQIAPRILPALTGADAARLRGDLSWSNDGVARLDGRLHVQVVVGGDEYLVPVPEIEVLSTRSGCDKSHIDGHRDLLLMSLLDGRISFKTPSGGALEMDYKPSYDTLTILAHALGNALIGSVLLATSPSAPFVAQLRTRGMSLAHWHAGMDLSLLPPGFVVFGGSNPPVSCSTHQAAIYALVGKLAAFDAMGDARYQYRGDVHIEPHHGINVSWPSLTDLARVLLSNGKELLGKP